MSLRHQYYGIEDLGLTATQRATLLDALKALGRKDYPQPAHINHWHIRADNRAVIFEGMLEADDWTLAALKNRLANLFGIAPEQIAATTQSTIYGPVVTFTRTTPRLRLVVFGSAAAAWEESRLACLQYLKDNASAWGD